MEPSFKIIKRITYIVDVIEKVHEYGKMTKCMIEVWDTT